MSIDTRIQQTTDYILYNNDYFYSTTFILCSIHFFLYFVQSIFISFYIRFYYVFHIFNNIK